MPDPNPESELMDLRRIGIHPDFWYPLAWSRELKKGKSLGVTFAGNPIVLARTQKGEVFALADRCSHRQVPLSLGVVCGETLKCCYHAWSYDKSGKCINIPYLEKGQSLPEGVRSYPSQEAYGLIFVFTGEPIKSEIVPFPDLPGQRDPEFKTRRLSRRIRCHYSFLHENLMDMNHQYLHRSLMGGIKPTLLQTNFGEHWYEAVYTFNRVSGRQSLGEKFMLGQSASAPADSAHDLMRVCTRYPYQTLTFSRANSEKPVLDLWLCYVPMDAEQKVNHSFGLMMIRKPSLPGLIHLFWPFIIGFTEGIFAQDRMIVEKEQAAHDQQGKDQNFEIFSVIRGLRHLLRTQGLPLKNVLEL